MSNYTPFELILIYNIDLAPTQLVHLIKLDNLT